MKNPGRQSYLGPTCGLAILRLRVRIKGERGKVSQLERKKSEKWENVFGVQKKERV